MVLGNPFLLRWTDLVHLLREMVEYLFVSKPRPGPREDVPRPEVEWSESREEVVEEA